MHLHDIKDVEGSGHLIEVATMALPFIPGFQKNPVLNRHSYISPPNWRLGRTSAPLAELQ